jgi:hypothetical protein
MIKFTSLLCVQLLALQVLFAQPRNREIVDQPIQWFALASNIKLSKSLTWMVEGQFRYASDFDPQQYQARTALEIHLSDHFSLVPLGYVYTWNYLYGEQPASFANNEHRIWQQIFYKHSLSKIKIDHRLRLEQRFIESHAVVNNEVIPEGYTNKQNRLRYRIMARMPINGAAIEAETLFLSVYDEAFFSWGKSVTFHEPDQNRIFVGLGYQVDEALTFQGGFLYQSLIKSNGAQQENNIGFQFQINYNFDLTKNADAASN